MNPEIETQIVESWDAISAWAQKGGDFVAEQAPLVAWEIVAYGRAINTALFALCVIAMIAIVVIWWRVKSRFGEGDIDDCLDTMVPLTIALCVPAFPLVFVAVSSSDNMLKSWFAPRLYVLEYVADLVGVMA